MTEDHVKEIANKADELIEIIKNIKATVGTNQNDTKKEVVIEDEGYADYGGNAETQNRDPNSWW
jgi:phosphoribosylaminoimidazole-succinocarboxamide synthase